MNQMPSQKSMLRACRIVPLGVCATMDVHASDNSYPFVDLLEGGDEGEKEMEGC